MRYFSFLLLTLLIGTNLYGAQKTDSELEKKAVKKELIAESNVSFLIRKYADGSVEWVPMPGMQTVVSKKHVKTYKKHVLSSLPKHLHKEYKKHAEGKSDEEELVSLATLSDLAGFNDPIISSIGHVLVSGMVGVVGGVITGNPMSIAQGAMQFGTGLVGGTKALMQYDAAMGKYRDYMKVMQMPKVVNLPPSPPRYIPPLSSNICIKGSPLCHVTPSVMRKPVIRVERPKILKGPLSRVKQVVPLKLPLPKVKM